MVAVVANIFVYTVRISNLDELKRFFLGMLQELAWELYHL